MMIKIKTPRLKEIDLKKVYRNKNGFITHPNINMKNQYLIKHGKFYYAGYFSREWYGLIFMHYEIGDIDLDDKQIKGIWQIRTHK